MKNFGQFSRCCRIEIANRIAISFLFYLFAGLGDQAFGEKDATSKGSPRALAIEKAAARVGQWLSVCATNVKYAGPWTYYDNYSLVNEERAWREALENAIREQDRKAVRTLIGEYGRIQESNIPGARIGLFLFDFNSKRTAEYRSHERFPLLQLVNLPVLLAAYDKVDRGELSLSDPVPIRSEFLLFRNNPLHKMLSSGKTELSLGELIRFAARDFSAGDLLRSYVGGNAVVRKAMASRKVSGFRVDRSGLEIQLANFGLPGISDLPIHETGLFLEAKKLPAEQRIQALNAFQLDPRDTASPQAVHALLQVLLSQFAINSGRRKDVAWGTVLRRYEMNLYVDSPLRYSVRWRFYGGTPILLERCSAFNVAEVIELADGRRVGFVLMISGAYAQFAQLESIVRQVEWLATIPL